MRQIAINEVTIEREEHLLRARQAAREASSAMGFNLVDQTRLITAVSELTRNVYNYAGRGVVTLEKVEKNARSGLMVTVTDRGPGIADIELAMTDGYSTGGGLGNGLGGCQRLVDEFDIRSKAGEGTVVKIVKWQS
ncbi:MAG: anti-sigma regulatory factor [Desulfobacterales bacterium]|nr:anti-sigma regulatory factor [Desulfobacterales bacterium]